MLCALAFAAVSVAILALGAAPVREDPVPEFGVVAFDLNSPIPARLAALGVGTVRGSCDWPTLEPSRRIFHWDCADNLIVGAEKLGLFSYMTVACTPGWANRDAGCAALPTDMADWYQFVQAFVTRYGAYHTTLGVWNEPNLTLRDADGAGYALLFVNASNARNTVNSRFPLGGPETSHHALASGYYVRTLDYIQSAHALDPQDVIAVHWYPDGPALASYMDEVSADGIGGANEVWLTEIGMSTPDPRAEAEFYRRTLETFEANANPRWSHVIFYRLWDGQACCSESILNADYTLKPAYFTLKFAIEKFRADRRMRERHPRAAWRAGRSAPTTAG